MGWDTLYIQNYLAESCIKSSFRQLDFLKKCLDKDPNERWTCELLLRHSYFDNFHFKMPDVETEEFEKLKKYRERSRVSLINKLIID